jgi:hypothetical protein
MKKHRTSINHQDGENHIDDLSLNTSEFAGMRQFSSYEAEIDSYLMDDKLQQFRKTIIKVNSKFKKAEKDNSVVLSKPLFKRVYIYAAAATIALLIGVYGITQYISISSKASPNKLFTEFYQPYQSDYIHRSDQVTINNLYLAFQAYENHEYNKAIGLFTKVTDADESIVIAYFYKGIACIETNNLAVATESFNKVLVNETNPYYPQAKWYMALTMLKLNNISEAKQLLSWLASNDRFYGKKSKELLTKLNN